MKKLIIYLCLLPSLAFGATYAVQQGDTAKSIAESQGVRLSDISGYRSGSADLIFPGEQLNIAQQNEPRVGGVAVAPLSPFTQSGTLISTRLTSSTLRVPSLVSLGCLGTDGDGDFQSGSCSAGATTTINGVNGPTFTFNVAGSPGLSYSTSSGTVTISQATSTDSVPGFLSAADHATFNAKQAAGSYAVTTNNLSDLSNASTARTNLGLVIGTNVQAYDADLTTYAGITPSANIQSLLGSANYSTARTNLGLAIGTDVQAYDADLTTYAGITPSANIQSLLGSADYSTARTNLGLAIGTNVQAYDADLTTYGGITPSANVQTLLGAANYAAFKSSLSLNNVENTALSTGNAGTATALAANGANCSAGSYPLGVDASGAVESCTSAAGGGSSSNVTLTARLATAAALPANTYLLGVLTAVDLGALTIDGIAVATNDVVLVKNEATGANNGLYTVTNVGSVGAAYILTRHTSMDASGEFVGAVIPIASEGTANKNTMWRNTNATAPTVGTTAITNEVQYLGAATATTINKLTITAPSSAATLTIANGATLTVNGSATITNGTHSGTNTGDQTSVSGNAGTATALAADGADCSAGSAPIGVNASGAVTSCTDYEEDLANSAGLLAALSDETGTDLAVFSNSPTFTDDFSIGAAGVKLTGADGVLTMLGLGNGNDEDLTIDFDNGTANNVDIGTGTGVTNLNLGAIVLGANTITLTGTGTLNGLDAIDATSETTIEAAIDTLANLTSVQGSTLTLAGAFITSGANSLTLTTTGATNVTLPTSGTLVNTTVATLSSLSSIGTITTGVWNGTDIAVADGGTGASTLTQNGVLMGNGTSAISAIAPATSTWVLTANGAGSAPTFQAPTSPALNVQTFNATTSNPYSWSKPTGGTVALIQVWAGGGSGGKGQTNGPGGGGGGGAYIEKWVLLSALGSTESVTVGAGGVGQTTGATSGNAGSNTTFGSAGTLMTAYGGGAGNGPGANGAGGGGGGGLAAVGATGGNAAGGAGGGPSGGSGGSASKGGDSTMGGGGGGSNATASAAGYGGVSVYGGGGGGSGQDTGGDGVSNGGGFSYHGGGGGGGGNDSGTIGLGGTSIVGGVGSAGATGAGTSSAGTQPGGGSGGTEGGNSGAGGMGQVIVTVF